MLEKKFPATAEALPETVADHCTEAKLFEKAIRCWNNAARHARARLAMVEEAALLKQALDVLPGLRRKEVNDRMELDPERKQINDRIELDLLIPLGAALIATKGWVPEVERSCARARKLCTEEDQNQELLSALQSRFQNHLLCSSNKDARQIAEGLLDLAEEGQRDAAVRLVGHHCLGVSLLFNGQLDPALEHFERTLALDVRSAGASRYWVKRIRVESAPFRALILLLQGHLERSWVCSQAALADADQLGHAYTKRHTLYLTCWLHQVRREHQVVEDRARQLMELAKEPGHSAWKANGTILYGWAVGVSRGAETGIAELLQGWDMIQAMGVLLYSPSFLGLLAGLYVKGKEGGEALKRLNEALARVERFEERWFEAELYRLKGDALLGCSSERAAEAVACYHQALIVARDQGARLWELRAATSLARLWRDQDKRLSPRPARAGLRLVHRGLRHRRPVGRQSAAQRAGMSRPAA